MLVPTAKLAISFLSPNLVPSVLNERRLENLYFFVTFSQVVAKPLYAVPVALGALNEDFEYLLTYP